MPLEQGGRRDNDDAGGQTIVPAEVVVLAVPKKEGKKFLNPGQYLHTVDLIRRLVDLNDPQEVGDLRIEPIEDFLELKDKGGLLGRINLRIYFKYFPDSNEVVVVKAYKKEEDGPAPRHIVLTVQ